MTTEELIQTWPEEWQTTLQEVVAEFRKRMPPGYTESCNGKMIHWVVPLSAYPAGYHCDPKSPLAYVSLASGKSGFTVHNFGIYMVPKLLESYKTSYEEAAKRKADLGKGCIKFKRPDHVLVNQLGDLVAGLSMESYIATYASMDPRNR